MEITYVRKLLNSWRPKQIIDTHNTQVLSLAFLAWYRDWNDNSVWLWTIILYWKYTYLLYNSILCHVEWNQTLACSIPRNLHKLFLQITTSSTGWNSAHSHTLLSFQSLYQARKASDNTCVLWVSIICFGLHEFRSFLTYVISILWYTCMWSSPSRVEGTMTFWLQPTPRTQARHPAWLSDWYIYCI
jgi:hypothetical protein